MSRKIWVKPNQTKFSRPISLNAQIIWQKNSHQSNLQAVNDERKSGVNDKSKWKPIRICQLNYYYFKKKKNCKNCYVYTKGVNLVPDAVSVWPVKWYISVLVNIGAQFIYIYIYI